MQTATLATAASSDGSRYLAAFENASTRAMCGRWTVGGLGVVIALSSIAAASKVSACARETLATVSAGAAARISSMSFCGVAMPRFDFF